MNIIPKEAPVYGCCKVVLEIYNVTPRQGVHYYIVLRGSQLRHTTVATPNWNKSILELTVTVPSHPEPETVEVSAYASRHGSTARLASAPFRYTLDSAHQMALYLLGSVDRPHNLRQLADCRDSFPRATREHSALDARLTAAFTTFRLPPCWNMMGTDLTGGEFAERLLHSSARLGLTKLSTHLLSLPGSQVALSTRNHERLLPEELAFENGFTHLGQLLQYYRRQSYVNHPYKPVIDQNLKDNEEQLVITTNTNQTSRNIEVDIHELEKRKRTFSDLESEDYEMKEIIHTNGSCFYSKDVTDSHRSASLPRQLQRSQIPRLHARVLEDNLRRIRDIHEGIQRLRELNTKHIAVHAPDAGSNRLSNSCPALYMTSGDDPCTAYLDGSTMRNTHQRRTSLNPPTSLAFIEPFNVKIHVNDLTPAASQEFLDLCSPLSDYNEGTNIGKRSNIGGTTSKRLAKRSNKKTPVRRQSWSSVGAEDETDGKQVIQRRWSLSSLESDNEDAFPNSTSSFRSQNCKIYHSSKNSNLSQIPRDKLRNFSDVNCVGESVLSKSSKQSSSVPSIAATEAKENVEPQKTHSVGSLSSSAKNFLVSFRSTPLQKSLSTPTITVEDAVEDQAKEDIATKQCSHPVSPLMHDCDETVADIQQLSLSLVRDVQMNSVAVDSDEEKVFIKRKKRSSIFFKKKPDKHKSKENKKVAHQFTVHSGSLIVCDACQKPFNKKQALKCENCLVVVHDSACKDQVLDCNKFKLQKVQTQQGKGSLPNSKFNFPLPHTNIPPLGEAASRSSFINLNKMLSEERDGDGSSELHSNITEINSASMESLDEGAVEISDLEDNQVLRLTDEEPETWNATVDKKVTKKLKDKEIKRQETIYELIITEKHHCLTLQIMQKVYAQGLLREVHIPRESVDRLFPCLGDLLDLHKAFLARLRERQAQSPIIEDIADILAEQFHDQKAEQMKNAYGQFCSQHLESLSAYKDMLKSDRKFQNFIKKCKSKRLCKTRGIPECLLLVTQRITKYILIMESLMKAAKDNKEEQNTLETILGHLKNIISSVDVQVAEKEKEMRLLEIFNRMDAKTTVFYRGKKFKKSDLLSCNRKLRKEGQVSWRSARGKTIDVLAVLLSDFILFLHESNQKLFFASLENKPGIVSLQKLLARKKAGQDSSGIYLISSNPNEPEMIELFCKSPKDQKGWMEAIREAIDVCPDEDEGIPSETEEERKLEAAKAARVKQLTNLLHEKDLNIALVCEDRMRILIDLLEMIGVETEHFENVKYTHLVENPPSRDTKELISSAISSASRLASNLYTSGTNLSRSVSSAGERQSEAYVSPLLPKRAETFGGFDNPTKEQQLKVPTFKRKLLHLKEYSENLPSKTKIEEANLGESLESALQNFGLQTSLSVIGKIPAICGSPEKSVNRKQYLSPSLVQHQSASFPPYREVSPDMMSATPLLLSQGKEQLMQIVELAHHLNIITCSVSHLSSSYESTKVELYEAEGKLSKLSKEKDRKCVYRPEHQLEELRNLQKQLNHDRAQWQQEKTTFQADMKAQREELEKLQEQLKREQSDVTHQRELLYRKLDALQKQGIILSPSHTVVNLNSCSPPDTDTPPPITTDQSHRRPYDVTTDQDIPYVYSGSSSAAPSHRIDSKNRPCLNLSSSVPSGKVVVPLHLSSSATNLQKRPSVAVQSVKQQLPLKLATNGGMTSPLQSVVLGPQQVLPMKLALGQQVQTAVIDGGKNAPKRSHSAASSPSSSLATPVHIRGGSSPALVQTTSGVAAKYKPEISILHHLKLANDKAKNKKDDANKEIFC